MEYKNIIILMFLVEIMYMCVCAFKFQNFIFTFSIMFSLNLLLFFLKQISNQYNSTSRNFHFSFFIPALSENTGKNLKKL